MDSKLFVLFGIAFVVFISGCTITSTPSVCGNGVCEENENSSSCEADCGGTTVPADASIPDAGLYEAVNLPAEITDYEPISNVSIETAQAAADDSELPHISTALVVESSGPPVPPPGCGNGVCEDSEKSNMLMNANYCLPDCPPDFAFYTKPDPEEQTNVAKVDSPGIVNGYLPVDFLVVVREDPLLKTADGKPESINRMRVAGVSLYVNYDKTPLNPAEPNGTRVDFKDKWDFAIPFVAAGNVKYFIVVYKLRVPVDKLVPGINKIRPVPYINWEDSTSPSGKRYWQIMDIYRMVDYQVEKNCIPLGDFCYFVDDSALQTAPMADNDGSVNVIYRYTDVDAQIDETGTAPVGYESEEFSSVRTADQYLKKQIEVYEAGSDCSVDAEGNTTCSMDYGNGNGSVTRYFIRPYNGKDFIVAMIDKVEETGGRKYSSIRSGIFWLTDRNPSKPGLPVYVYVSRALGIVGNDPGGSQGELLNKILDEATGMAPLYWEKYPNILQPGKICGAACVKAITDFENLPVTDPRIQKILKLNVEASDTECIYTIPGDVDGRGGVDATDVQKVINIALGVGDEKDIPCADIDKSGNIDAVDVQLVINAALGIGPPVDECGDSIDNDGDGYCDTEGCIIEGVRFGRDPGCTSSLNDTDEHDSTKVCDDGLDNDHDGATDFRLDGSGDPGCDGFWDLSGGGELNPNVQCDDGLNNDNNDPDDGGALKDYRPEGSETAGDPDCTDLEDNDEYGIQPVNYPEYNFEMLGINTKCLGPDKGDHVQFRVSDIEGTTGTKSLRIISQHDAQYSCTTPACYKGPVTVVDDDPAEVLFSDGYAGGTFCCGVASSISYPLHTFKLWPVSSNSPEAPGMPENILQLDIDCEEGKPGECTYDVKDYVTKELLSSGECANKDN